MATKKILESQDEYPLEVIDNLIDKAIEKKSAEITAYLMDYKNSHFGTTDKQSKILWDDEE